MSVNAATVAQSVTALDKVLADVKYRLGTFLANQKILLDGKTRLEELLNAGVPGVSMNAKALSAKGDALLKIQADIEKEAQALVMQGSGLKDKIQSDPFYSFLKTTIIHWGLRQYEIVADLIKTAANFSAQAANLSARMLKQNADVKTFTNEVRGTESAAAGTGYVPKITGILSASLTSVVNPLAGVLKPAALTAGAALGLAILFRFGGSKR